jgi:hypothetical protein
MYQQNHSGFQKIEIYRVRQLLVPADTQQELAQCLIVLNITEEKPKVD